MKNEVKTKVMRVINGESFRAVVKYENGLANEIKKLGIAHNVELTLTGIGDGIIVERQED